MKTGTSLHILQHTFVPLESDLFLIQLLSSVLQLKRLKINTIKIETILPLICLFPLPLLTNFVPLGLWHPECRLTPKLAATTFQQWKKLGPREVSQTRGSKKFTCLARRWSDRVRPLPASKSKHFPKIDFLKGISYGK